MAETANVLTPLIWQVDETMFKAQTESESASKKSAEKMIDNNNKKNRKMAAELCDELCVCVYGETGGWVFSCVITLIVQNERMFSVSPTIQLNPLFCLWS